MEQWHVWSSRELVTSMAVSQYLGPWPRLIHLAANQSLTEIERTVFSSSPASKLYISTCTDIVLPNSHIWKAFHTACRSSAWYTDLNNFTCRNIGIFWSNEGTVPLQERLFLLIFPLVNLEVLCSSTLCLPVELHWWTCHHLSHLDYSVQACHMLKQLKLFVGLREKWAVRLSTKLELTDYRHNCVSRWGHHSAYGWTDRGTIFPKKENKWQCQ
jgi:hypothetical protein